MSIDLSKLRSLDTETHKFRPGLVAPPIVCASVACFADDQIKPDLIVGDEAVYSVFKKYLDEGCTIAFANASYDLLVYAQKWPSLFPAIFKALREGRIHDILIAQALDQIYHGTLGVDPKTGTDMRSPTTDKTTNRYSLELVHYQLTGKVDAKSNDTWRKSYALLDGVPVEKWPEEAAEYPKDDAANTLEDATLQIFGAPAPHTWKTIPGIPGFLEEKTICIHCNGELTFSWPPHGSKCASAPREGHKNSSNLREQVEAAFAASLGAAHGFRTDGERVAKLTAIVEKKQETFVKRFQAKGWIREDGSENQIALKRAIAIAYGANRLCSRCGGKGTTPRVTMIKCRGEKVRGRFQGCGEGACEVCHGNGTIEKIAGDTTCKPQLSDKKEILEDGCDGTGLDLNTATDLPRSSKTQGIKTDRDTLEESGDDDVVDYGDATFAKSISTYLPYLRKGIHQPLTYSPNPLVETGRYSYEGSPMHQMPRKGGERECIRARGAWCGSPIEYAIGSTDYEAGELVTLAQYCYWTLGHSKMRDVINETGKPGILHSDLAAQILGLPLEEFLVRLKAKNKQAVDFRQASKSYLFGRPGLMGPAKIVMTNRKSSVGFTPCEGGPSESEDANGNMIRGYHGIRYCILLDGATSCGDEKITEWKRHKCPPVCKRCTKVVDTILGAAYDKRYPEMPEYFKWVFKTLDKHGGRIPCLVWDPQEGKPKVVRWRGGVTKPAACNNGFQAMLSDVIKLAYVNGTRECYLGVKDDGSPSPLAGSRIPIVVHDEPVSELILDRAWEAGPRIAEIMVDAGKAIAPDVTWRAETAISLYFSKSMEPVYDENKCLMLWAPKEKKVA